MTAASRRQGSGFVREIASGGWVTPGYRSESKVDGTPVPVIGRYLRDHADALTIRRPAAGISGSRQARQSGTSTT
jgi:hypothetical protein